MAVARLLLFCFFSSFVLANDQVFNKNCKAKCLIRIVVLTVHWQSEVKLANAGENGFTGEDTSDPLTPTSTLLAGFHLSSPRS